LNEICGVAWLVAWLLVVVVMLTAMEWVDTGSQSEDVVPHGAEPGRYSSSLKRALNPAVEETGTRKKVSLTSLSNGGADLEEAYWS
jgi:hypothetical protein